MPSICLVTPEYFTANGELIRSLWAQANPRANIQPVDAEAAGWPKVQDGEA